MESLRDTVLIRVPGVRHDTLEPVLLDDLPQLLAGFAVAGTQDAVEELLCISINSNPNPAKVFFVPI